MPHPDHDNKRLRHYNGPDNLNRRNKFARDHLNKLCAHETLKNRQNWTVLRPLGKPWAGKAFVGYKEGQPKFGTIDNKHRQPGSATRPKRMPAKTGSLCGIVAVKKILVVLGNSGCGKTVLNAALAQCLCDASDDEDGTIWHFIFVFGKFESHQQFAQVIGEAKALLIDGVDTDKHAPKMKALRGLLEHALQQQRDLNAEHGHHPDGTPKHRSVCPLDDLAELVKQALTTRGKGAWLPDFLNKVRESGLLICIFMQPTCMPTFSKLLQWEPSTITMWMGNNNTSAVNLTDGKYTAAEFTQVLAHVGRDPAVAPRNECGGCVLQYMGETGRRIEVFQVQQCWHCVRALPLPPLTLPPATAARRSPPPWPTGRRPSSCPTIGSLPPRPKTAPETTRVRTRTRTKTSSPHPSRRRRAGGPAARPTARTATSLPPLPPSRRQATLASRLSPQTATQQATSPWAGTR
jgi:hypothetical protein